LKLGEQVNRSQDLHQLEERTVAERTLLS
jgi:hypothetical protein